MNWRDFIAGIYYARPQEPGIATKPAFYPGASPYEIAEAEVQLEAIIPSSIKALLLETNGVMNMLAIDNGEWFEDMWLVWTISEIVEHNRRCRSASGQVTYERDFRELLFFAGAGSDGILFGFPCMEDHVCSCNVSVWYPIEDELTQVATSFDEFLEAWLMGTISI